MNDEQPKNPLQRDGSTRSKRMPDQLRPETPYVDNRKDADLQAFASGISKLIHFHRKDGTTSDWSRFFDPQTVRESDPHYTLFLTFLRLFGHAQQHINSLTKKHLDFYYKEVLRLNEKPAKEDRVHVLFELTKNVNKHLLEASKTYFKAGKDPIGKELIYQLEKDMVVNRGRIDSICSVYVDPAHNRKVFDAPVANSADGFGAKLEGSEPKWSGFGSSQYNNDPSLEEGKPVQLLPKEQRTMQESSLGFAFSSPLLFLQEGVRTITLSLETAGKDGRDAGTLFKEMELLSLLKIQFSGAEDWISIDPTEVRIISGKHLQIKVLADAMVPPIVAYNKEALLQDFNTVYPVMKVLVHPGFYGLLVQLNLINAVLKVNVEGIYNNTLHSKRSVLDPGKAFLPFGPLPEKGNELFIGNQEVFQKRLDSLSIGVNWADVPDFEKHYAVYEKITPNEDNLTADISILNRKRWMDQGTVKLFKSSKLGESRKVEVKPEGNRFELFTGKGEHPYFFRLVDASDRIVLRSEGYKQERGRLHGVGSVRENALYDSQFERKIASDGTHFFTIFATNQEIVAVSQFFKTPGEMEAVIRIVKEIAPEAPIENIESGESVGDQGIIRFSLGEIREFERDPDFPWSETYTQGVPRGFLKLRLNYPFGHSEFPTLNSRITIQNALNEENHPYPLPNEPYTPTINSLFLNYSSSETVDLHLVEDQDSIRQDYEKRIEQFYHLGAFGLAERHPYTATDLKNFTLLPQYEDQGYLYIGLKDLELPSSLSILFQVAEGTADPDLETGGKGVQWSYLSENHWIPFHELQILADETNNFQTSGIIKFDIPKEATKDNTLMPAGMHWLRGSIDEPPESLCQLIDLHTQAAVAVFRDNDNDPDHLTAPLKEGKITKMTEKLAAIKKVSQPYASFEGAPKEQDHSFYARVSERLRHKNRAVTVWDYERMVLDQFPSIYKVRCLNHTSKGSELDPGKVTLIVIPNLRNKNAVNPLQPKTSRNQLILIRDYLRKYCSPFVQLQVQNPIYEEILADFSVGFLPGYDRGFYGQELNEEIKRFLSPWAYDEGEDILLTGKVYKSVLLKFIESREYVDYVNQFRLYHIKKGIKHIGAGIGLMAISEDLEFIVSMEETDEVVEPTSSRAVLVSAENHHISVIRPGESSCRGGELGIGYMMIDVNFEVN